MPVARFPLHAPPVACRRATMDERRQLSPPPAERRREASSPARALSEQREQVKRFVTEIADAADLAEQEIASSVNRLLEDLSAEHAALQEKYEAAGVNRWGDKSRQLEERERELAALEESLRRREAESAESWKRFEDERRRHQADAEDSAHRQARYEERRRRLEALEEELESREQQTKNQRRRIAAELREERENLRRERRRQADELQRRTDELERLAQDLQRRSEQLDRRAADAVSAAGDDDDLRREIRELENALSERNAALHELTDRCDDLRVRLGDYKAKLADAEARAEAAESQTGDSGEAEEWRRRYEIAQEEIQELKRRRAASAPAAEPVTGSDWESQKRRILAELETDFDGQDPDSQADRLTIEGTIRITDGVVAQKDDEIAELKRQLAQRSEVVVVPPPDFDDAVQRDEYLAARRVEIDALKAEWEEKVRRAEIEMSLERAKLARERMEFEERRAEFDHQNRGGQEITVKSGSDEPKRTGGRWLARLGLREKDE